MRTRRPFVLACLMALICLVALPTAHAASKVSKYAYAAESGQIVVYTVNPDGGLRAIQAVANPLCIQPAVSPSNKFVYTTSNVNGSQSIAGYSIGKTGTLTPLAGSPFASTGAHFLAFGKTGKFAYAVDNTASNDVEEFAVNATTGALTPIGTIFTGVYAGDITINPKGTVAYVANYGNNTISAFSINPTSGVLTAVSGSPFASGNAGPSLDRVSPNGKYLFSVNAANTGSISVFSINSKTGALTLISDNQFPAGWGYSGGDAKLDPSGKFLYVGSFSAIGVEAFP